MSNPVSYDPARRREQPRERTELQQLRENPEFVRDLLSKNESRQHRSRYEWLSLNGRLCDLAAFKAELIKAGEDRRHPLFALSRIAQGRPLSDPVPEQPTPPLPKWSNQ